MSKTGLSGGKPAFSLACLAFRFLPATRRRPVRCTGRLLSPAALPSKAVWPVCGIVRFVRFIRFCASAGGHERGADGKEPLPVMMPRPVSAVRCVASFVKRGTGQSSTTTAASGHTRHPSYRGRRRTAETGRIFSGIPDLPASPSFIRAERTRRPADSFLPNAAFSAKTPFSFRQAIQASFPVPGATGSGHHSGAPFSGFPADRLPVFRCPACQGFVGKPRRFFSSRFPRFPFTGSVRDRDHLSSGNGGYSRPRPLPAYGRARRSRIFPASPCRPA